MQCRQEKGCDDNKYLVHGCKEVLVSQGECLLAPKVKVLWIVVDKFWLRSTSSLRTGLSNAIKRHKSLSGDVVDLVLCFGVAQDLVEGCC